MKNYNLGFIDNESVYNHVRETVLQYRRSINLAEFNKNLIDPIKLSFDSKIYNQSVKETIGAECLRQIDKTNNNCIGYFHQYIFKYAPGGWEVPKNGEKGGFDVINKQMHIYVALADSSNFMSPGRFRKTYIKMQAKILEDDKAVCMLVEVMARHSQDIKWEMSIDGKRFSHDRIRCISIDKFYGKVFGDRYAFFKLCKALPSILDDVIADDGSITLTNTVYDELDKNDSNRSIYNLAFSTYEGFQCL